MQLTALVRHSQIGVPSKKLLLVMNLTAIFLLAICLQVSATGFSQKVSLNLKNAPVKKVFKEVSRQTGISIVYSESLISGLPRVSINVTDAPMETVLKECLGGGLDFALENNAIVIKQKPAAPQRQIEAAPVIDISGKVTDEEGHPLQGANVKVSGSKDGTTTDINGVFLLKGVDEKTTLIISYVGYHTLTVQVNNQISIVVSLKLNVEDLGEVVINKGYYTEKQRLSVGNAAVVSGKDIEKQPVNNPLLALQGRVSGLFITQNTGVPGGGVTVRIQGQNSIQNGSDPLYVVDGVPFTSQLPTLAGGTILGSSGGMVGGLPVGVGNPLSFINPADIESISVLKDADATAIYGSRAANGAILITTKKGRAGAMKLDLNIQQGIGHVTRNVPVLNAQQYLEMRHEALKNAGQIPSSIDYDFMLWDTTRNTDWQKELLGGNAQYTQLSADVSGGTASLQYLLGATFHRETTVFPGSFSDRKGSVHFNLNSSSTNQRLRLQFTGNYMFDDNQLPGSDLTSVARLLEPVAPALYNNDGTLNWAPNASGKSTWTNPLAQYNNTFQATTNNLITNLSLNYNISPGLQAGLSTGYTILQSYRTAKFPLSAVKPERRATTTRTSSVDYMNLTTWIIEPNVNYNHKIGPGLLDVLVGGTIQENAQRTSGFTGSGFSDDAAMDNINSAVTITSFAAYRSQYKYNAVYGRLNYNVSNKYLFNFNARRDGSSRFGPSNRFSFFGSIGAGWIFSEENWFKEKVPVLSFGKLRGSYGTSGSDQIPDYSYMDLYINSIAPYQGIQWILPNALFNRYLEWEATKKLQGGIDIGFFKDRLRFGFTYQRNRSSNQLLPYKLPSITGFGSITANFPATVQNTSWEGSLTTSIFKGNKFSWSAELNLTVPQNKLISFPKLEQSSYANGLIIGQPISIIKVSNSSGVDPATGTYIHLDKNGSEVPYPSYPSDFRTLINLLPSYYGGIENSLSYGNFQLELLFQFSKQLGNDITKVMNSTLLYPGQFFGGFSNQSTSVLDRWQKPGDNATTAQFTTNPSISYYFIGSSNYLFDDASYLRLKNLSLSYQFPVNWCKTMHLRNARIYLSGQNLLTVSSFKNGDPETQSQSSLPPLRVITGGIQLGL